MSRGGLRLNSTPVVFKETKKEKKKRNGKRGFLQANGKKGQGAVSD